MGRSILRSAHPFADGDQTPMMPTERAETLALRWPVDGQRPGLLPLKDRYSINTGVDSNQFRQVQGAIGFEVNDAVWAELTESLADNAMTLAVDAMTESAVAAALAEQRGPWLELGWVAVAPRHRGNGLGYAVCCALVTHLLAEGQTRLFGSTQDHRLAALSIYFALGFHPVLRPEKMERWRVVCGQLGVAFTPELWR